jgi:hypothetical protein
VFTAQTEVGTKNNGSEHWKLTKEQMTTEMPFFRGVPGRLAVWRTGNKDNKGEVWRLYFGE